MRKNLDLFLSFNLVMDLFQQKTKDHIIDLFSQVQNTSIFKWDWFALSLNKTLPFYLVEAFVDKQWDWTVLSCHPSLTWSFVLDNIDKPWYWPVISSHRIVTCDIVLNHLDLAWDWGEMSYNRNITWKFVHTFWFKSWDWRALSSHIEITIEELSASGFFPWSWDELSDNEHVIKNIIALRRELSEYEKGNQEQEEQEEEQERRARYIHLHHLWNFVMNHFTAYHWSLMSTNPYVTLSIVLETPDIPWNYESFFYNPNIAWSHVEQALVREGNLDWISRLSASPRSLLSLISDRYLAITLSMNLSIPLERILDILERYTTMLDHPRRRPFNTWELTRREDMTFEILQRILMLDSPFQIPICWPALSKNKNFTWPIIQANLSLPWCWFNLSMNPNISLKIVKDNPDFPWNWDGLSCNKNISLRVLKEEGEGRSKFNPLLLSSHIHLQKLEDNDIDAITSQYLQCQSGLLTKMLSRRETGTSRRLSEYLTRLIECGKNASMCV